MQTTNKKRIPIEKIILATIGAAGLIAMIAVAPGAGPALRMFGFGRKNYSSRYINDAITRLRKKGLVVFHKDAGKTKLRLTENGRKLLESRRKSGYDFPKPTSWDGKWRVVIFDISEKRRAQRDKLRRELLGIGFIRLQNSVWVYPYDCEEFIKLLKADYQVGKNVLYIVAERVEYDKPLKTSFNL